MKNSTTSKIILIAQIILAVAAVILLIMSMMTEDPHNHYLSASLGCISINTLINIRRMAVEKKKQ